MKTLLNTAILGTISLALLLNGCKKDEESDFVSDYNPALTEASGTEYTGDYFPIGAYYNWEYEGTETTKGTYKETENGETDTENYNETDDVTASISVGALQSIALNAGNKNLYPYYDDTNYTRYVEKTSGGVFVRAYLDEDEEIVEISNPTFIKSPLIVGDTWEVDPLIEFSDLEGFDKSDLSVKSKFIVVGKEVKTWNNSSYNTVRLDQRSEITLSTSYNEDGEKFSIYVNLQITSKYNLIKDIGIAFQVNDMHMIEDASMSFEGESASMYADVIFNNNMVLSSYDFDNATSSRETTGLKTAKSSSIISTKNEIINKLISKYLEASKKAANKVSLK